jgi:hypothetical protein
MKFKPILFAMFLLIAALALAACGGQPDTVQETAEPVQSQAPVQQACPTAAPCPTPEPVEASPADDLAMIAAWQGSPHADASAEAFVHWDEEDPAEVPTSCAKCHSTPGYLDFLGEDGSAAGTVDAAAPIGTVVSCQACHNAATATKTTVVFPSGIEITGLDDSSRCMECHQGRASKVQVDETLARYGADVELDTVPEPVDERPLGFINIHYFAAAATKYGTMVKGGYEYDGKSYDSVFNHVEGFNTCAGCHDPHTTELKIEQCAGCHEGVAAVEDLRNIRMVSSVSDYDGDGDVEEGVASEIAGLQEMLLTAIRAYGAEVAGAPIGYNAAAHPYWFGDPNDDGEIGEDEANSDNAYPNWTGRLEKAAYNYQVSLKDPGAYAHNGKYIIQLLYDSIEDLNTQLATPVDLTTAQRIDAGHFAGSEEAFRHWDEEEGNLVPADCVKCHTSRGLPMFLGEASRARDLVTGVTVAVKPANGFECSTCHDDSNFPARYPVTQVKFPSGAILSFSPDDETPADANLCIECHQGRESKVSVDRAIAQSTLGDDEPAAEGKSLGFRNPHYFAAGSTLFGTQAKGAYEFDGQEYNGRFMHVEGFNTCVNCHNAHALTVNVQACSGCHTAVETVEDLAAVRMDNPPVDYDGDGDTAEGIAGEVQTMHEALYAAMQAYAVENAGGPIQYNAFAYPYWYQDPNENGEIDDGEEALTAWTPNLLRAAYNYQWVAKDPGAFAHNGRYVLQFLYDSIQAVGGDTSGMTRPQVTQPPAE